MQRFRIVFYDPNGSIVGEVIVEGRDWRNAILEERTQYTRLLLQTQRLWVGIPPVATKRQEIPLQEVFEIKEDGTEVSINRQTSSSGGQRYLENHRKAQN